MFGKRTSRRLKSPTTLVVRGRFKRLRVEPMEARLMLSATSIELSYPNLATGESLFRDIQFVFAPADFAPTKPYKDGGFIELDQSGILLDAGTSTAWNYGTIGNSQTPNLNEDIFATNGSDANGQGQTRSFSDSSLQLVRYFNVGQSFVIASATNTQTVKIAQEVAQPDEGGAISIPTLVANLKQEDHLAKNEAAIPASIDDATGDAHRSHRSAASAKSVLSGEWARATAFETVSTDRGANELSEAAASQSDSAAQDASAPKSETPTSVTTKNSTPDTLSQRDKTALKNNTPNPADLQDENGEATVQPAVHRIEAADWHWLGDVPLTTTLAAPLASTKSLSNGIAGQESDLEVALTADELFDAMGQPVANISASIAEEKPSLITRSAVPLLMILAMERIATFSSRNSTRVSSTVPTPRSRTRQ